MTTRRVLADFEGAWTLLRHISHADGTQAQYRATAVFRPDGDSLAYGESGYLKIGDAAPVTANRRYRWGPDLDVFFDDGRFFHRVPAVGGRAEHWCDPDTYVVDYDFSDWPAFTVTWQVRGPRKDYRMVSRFTRPAAF